MEEEVRCNGWARQLGDIQLPQAGTCDQGEKAGSACSESGGGGLGGIQMEAGGGVGWCGR